MFNIHDGIMGFHLKGLNVDPFITIKVITGIQHSCPSFYFADCLLFCISTFLQMSI